MYNPNRPYNQDARFKGPFSRAEIDRAGDAPDAVLIEDSDPTEPAETTPSQNDLVAVSSGEGVPFSAEEHLHKLIEGVAILGDLVRADGNEPHDLESWKRVVDILNETRSLARRFKFDNRSEKSYQTLAERMKDLSREFTDEVAHNVGMESTQMLIDRISAAVASADSFEDLYDVLGNVSHVPGSSTDFTPAELKSLIEQARATGRVDTITRTAGLRSKVIDLIAQEGGGEQGDSRDELRGLINALEKEAPNDPHEDAQSGGRNLGVESVSDDAADTAAEKRKTAEGRAELAGVSAEREALLAAERDLQANEGDFVTHNGLASRAAHHLFNTDRADTIYGMEDRVDIAAAKYHQKLEASLQQRLVAKGLTPNTPAYDKLAQKYREMVASKDVIDRGERARAKAKRESIQAKGGVSFDAALRTLGSMNSYLEKKLGSKDRARVVRIIGSALTAATVAAVLTPVSLAAVAGYAGARVLRSGVGAYVGSYAGSGAGSLYGATFGKVAAEKLAEQRRAKRVTAEGIFSMREAYRSGNKESIERKRKLTEMISAALVGGAASFGTSYVEALHATPGVLDSLHGHQAGVGSVESRVDQFSPPTHLDTAHIEDVPVDAPQAHIDTVPVDTPSSLSAPSPVAEAAVSNAYAQLESLPPIRATPGYGYEYMLKRLSEQLHEQRVDVSHMDPTSDAYRLATAPPEDVDALVHAMAKDDAHAFFRGPDGSVRVGLHANVSLNSSGAVEFNDGMGHVYVQAPPDTPITPDVHRGGLSGTRPEVNPQETADRIRQWHHDNPEYGTAAPEVDASGNVHAPNYVAGSDLPKPGQPGYHAFNPQPREMPFTNPHGFEVDPGQAHVYAMPGGSIVADGGNYDERLRAAVNYVQQHGGRVQIEAKAPVYIDGYPTRYLETVSNRGFLGLGGRIEPDVLVGKPDPESIIREPHKRFAMRFVKKLT